jgi:hypothetical protein
MSLVQRFAALILPASMMTAIEKESRRWIMHCQVCGESLSVWDAGGIRYLAAGRKWMYRRCSHCSRQSWQSIEFERTATGNNS